jgi:hypothetical protein
MQKRFFEKKFSKIWFLFQNYSFVDLAPGLRYHVLDFSTLKMK